MIRVFVDASGRKDNIGIGIVIDQRNEDLIIISRIKRTADKNHDSYSLEMKGIELAIELCMEHVNKSQDTIMIYNDNKSVINYLSQNANEPDIQYAFLNKRDPELKPFLVLAHSASRMYLQPHYNLIKDFKNPISSNEIKTPMTLNLNEFWSLGKDNDQWLLNVNKQVVRCGRKPGRLVKDEFKIKINEGQKLNIGVDSAIYNIIIDPNSPIVPNDLIHFVKAIQ